MKPTKTEIIPSLDDSIAELHKLAANIQGRHRKNCHEAVLAGMHLSHIKDQLGLQNGGDRRSLSFAAESRKSFSSVLEEGRVPKKSAYRWISKARELATALGILSEDTEEQEPFPAPGTPDWNHIAAAAEQWSQNTSMDRLQIGGTADDPDEQRLEHLMSSAEAGDTEALMWLDRWRSGQITLARAVCAYGGSVATKGKERKDPVYLEYDLMRKQPMGLIPKAITTLRNGFEAWDSYDADARDQVRGLWREVIKKAPAPLLEIIRQQLKS